jgi:hypothetical protein
MDNQWHQVCPRSGSHFAHDVAAMILQERVGETPVIV